MAGDKKRWKGYYNLSTSLFFAYIYDKIHKGDHDMTLNDLIHLEYNTRRNEDFGIYAKTEEMVSELITFLDELIDHSSHKPLLVLDLCSGCGDFGEAVAASVSECCGETTLYFVDSNPKRLQNCFTKYKEPAPIALSSDSYCNGLPIMYETIDRVWLCGDVMKMSADIKFDILSSRFGPKEIPKELQNAFFQKCNDLLKPQGLLMIMDMVSNDEFLPILNRIHWLKHRLGGRKIDGHILSVNQLQELLEHSNFSIEKMEIYRSQVNTRDWAKNGQLSSAKVEIVENLIKGADPNFKTKFCVSFQKNGSVDIVFPIVFIIAKRRE
jgi:SAM-dependent methyltransferase